MSLCFCQGSAHDETDAVGHLPPLPRSKSIQSIDSVGSAQSPRLRTPREIGRDAALKRLEELGFDEMAKEFGMSQSPKVTPRRDFFRQTDYEREQFSETPLGSYPGDLNINSPIIAKTKGQRTRPLSESAKWEKVVEEPLLSESIVKDEFASNEMILQGLDADAVTEEMLAAEHLDKNHIKLKPEDGIRNSTKKEAIKPLESSRIEDEATEGYQTVMVTEADRLKFDEQYQISSENNALLKRQQSLQDDLRMQQERILETIAALGMFSQLFHHYYTTYIITITNGAAWSIEF